MIMLVGLATISANLAGRGNANIILITSAVMALGFAMLLTSDGLGIFVVGITGSVMIYESSVTNYQVPRTERRPL
jgi:hypothetical protein